MKFVIVGVQNYPDIQKEMNCCYKKFRKKGIPILKMVRRTGFVETPNCIIRFHPVSDFEKARGFLCDASFCFSEEEQCLLNQSHKPTDFDGTYVDYVSVIEGY